MEVETLTSLRKRKRELIGNKSKGSLYICWRSKVFTEKGKRIGFPNSWRTFEGFKKDIPDGFEEGLILVRKDTSFPFSKENTKWIDKSEQGEGRMIELTYNGKTQKLIEWALELNINYNGLRQRYFKGKNYTTEQVLLGKNLKANAVKVDISELGYQKQKDKISKMLSAYKHRDKVRGFEYNLDKKFFISLTNNPCFYCGDTKLVGADRIDNYKGHTKDNVLPCCYVCNVVRGNFFTVDEMKIIGATIKQIKEERVYKSQDIKITIEKKSDEK